MLGMNQSKHQVTDCRSRSYFPRDAVTLGCSLVFTARKALRGSHNPLKCGSAIGTNTSTMQKFEGVAALDECEFARALM